MRSSDKTGFVYSEAYLQHDTGGYHPESPERLKAIVERLERDGILTKLVLIEPSSADLDWITTGLGLLAMLAVGGLMPFLLWVYYTISSLH